MPTRLAHVAAGIAALLPLAFTGCTELAICLNSPSSVAFEIEVFDSVTGASLASPPTRVVASDGTANRELEAGGAGFRGTIGSGSVRITVTRPGYVTWESSTLQIALGDCGFHHERYTVALTPDH
jgi:hypothetical protein